MHRLPTRIEGVELLRDACLRRAGGAVVVTRSPLLEYERGPSAELIIAADFGFTNELSYTQRRPISRTFRCRAGEVFVAAADIRLESPTFGHWQGFYLRKNDARALSIAPGIACGWQVTSSEAELEVRATGRLDHDVWRWLRWNDLELAIAWPEIPEQLSHHSRRSRSLATLSARALPEYKATQGVSPGENASAKSTQQSTLQSTLKPAVHRQSDLSPHGNAPRVSSKSPAPEIFGTEIEHDRTSLQSRRVGLAAKPSDELILVIGSSGQLGRDLCRKLASLGTVVGACREPERGSLLPIPMRVDVSRPASIRQAIRAIKPTLIVNASGMTDLDKAEREPRLAQLINATAPAVIADEAKALGCSLVHFCSDMVYDGTGDRPWRETDLPRPINQYGRTKLLGTEAIRHSGIPHLILRSGWLYGTQGPNYVSQLVDLLTYRNSIELACDHVGTPTSTEWLASMTAQLLKRRVGSVTHWLSTEGGLFHVAPLGYASRLEVGDHIAATCRAHALPVVSHKFKAVPVRSLAKGFAIPANCQLDCSKLALHFGFEFPRWQQQLSSQLSLWLTHGSVSARHVA